jgi:hypothetical protein
VFLKKKLLYGMETWTCTETEKSKIQATEIKFLSAIMGKTKRDRFRNAHIRKELRMEDIQNQTEGNIMKWFEHVKRMDKHRIQKRLLEMKMTGKRPRGRP